MGFEWYIRAWRGELPSCTAPDDNEGRGAYSRHAQNIFLLHRDIAKIHENFQMLAFNPLVPNPQ